MSDPLAHTWDADFLTRSPAFEALRASTRRLDLRAWPDADALTLAATQGAAPLLNARGLPVRFVREASPDDLRYEQRIHDRGEVHCRAEDWHDLFNALVWMTFPNAKAALNVRQIDEMRHDPPGQRSRARDAMTLFDEGGALVCSSDAGMLDLLRGFRWKELFWYRRQRFMETTRVIVFGHAMYHKLLNPFIGMTSLTLLSAVDEDFIEWSLSDRLTWADHTLATRLRDAAAVVTPRDLAPLPILGVPGWYEAGAREGFYDDQRYFRPGRGAAQGLIRG